MRQRGGRRGEKVGAEKERELIAGEMIALRELRIRIVYKIENYKDNIFTPLELLPFQQQPIYFTPVLSLL